MRRALAPILIVLVSGACARTFTAPAPIASIAVADAGSGGTFETPPHASEIACRFAHANASFAVSLRRDGPVYARIDTVDDVLTLPIGDAMGAAKLVHAAEGVHIETFVESKNIDLHLTKAAPFGGGWYLPYAWSPLRWTSGREGALALEPVIDSQDNATVELTIVNPPHAVLPCEALSVTVKEEFETLPEEPSGESYVRVGERIPLSRGPGGSPIASIRFTIPEDAKVAVLERRAAAVRVAITAWPPATLMGWIPDAALVTTPPVSGPHITRAPTVRMGSVQRRNVRTVTCASSTPLVAQTKEGTRARIGEIDPGATFVFYAGDGDEREVQLRGVRPLDETRLLVPSSVEGCK